MSVSEFTKQKVEKEERITSKGMTEEEVRKRYDELKSMDNFTSELKSIDNSALAL